MFSEITLMMTGSHAAKSLLFAVLLAISAAFGPAGTDAQATAADARRDHDSAPAAERMSRLRAPLACAEATCFIQNFPDVAPGPLVRDPFCGGLSYDGHDGLDFRVSLAQFVQGAPVLAPADGVVLGVRDGEPDGQFLRAGQASLQGRDCGNGVGLDHGGGLTTQLCHLKNGSLKVRTGERVKAGQVIGLVGLSGAAQFPHVHVSAFVDRQKIDPLTGTALGASPCKAEASVESRAVALWDLGDAETARALQRPTGQIIDVAFFAAPPRESDPVYLQTPAQGAAGEPALIFWAQAAPVRLGDELMVTVVNAGGAAIATHHTALEKDRAQASVFTGLRRSRERTPLGVYRGEAVLRRAGAIISRQELTIMLK